MSELLPEGIDLTIATLEKTHIARVLAENKWNVTLCAKLLGISKPTLYRRILEYGLINEASK